MPSSLRNHCSETGPPRSGPRGYANRRRRLLRVGTIGSSTHPMQGATDTPPQTPHRTATSKTPRHHPHRGYLTHRQGNSLHLMRLRSLHDRPPTVLRSPPRTSARRSPTRTSRPYRAVETPLGCIAAPSPKHGNSNREHVGASRGTPPTRRRRIGGGLSNPNETAPPAKTSSSSPKSHPCLGEQTARTLPATEDTRRAPTRPHHATTLKPPTLPPPPQKPTRVPHSTSPSTREEGRVGTACALTVPPRNSVIMPSIIQRAARMRNFITGHQPSPCQDELSLSPSVQLMRSHASCSRHTPASHCPSRIPQTAEGHTHTRATDKRQGGGKEEESVGGTGSEGGQGRGGGEGTGQRRDGTRPALALLRSTGEARERR